MIAGEVVGPEDLLALDDFALAVLIDNVAHADRMDPVAQELAHRILARDLFKMVPVPAYKVNDFLRREDAYQRLHHAVRPYCAGPPEWYLHVDVSHFHMFAEPKEEWGYFIDDDRRAIPAREEESLRPLWRAATESVRLFTVREAVDAVAALVG
jgi:hypothetical protein